MAFAVLVALFAFLQPAIARKFAFMDIADYLDALYDALKEFPAARIGPGGAHLRPRAWSALLDHRDAIREAADELRALRSRHQCGVACEGCFRPPRLYLGPTSSHAGTVPEMPPQAADFRTIQGIGVNELYSVVT